MNGVVIYKSRYGTTQEYAERIRTELGIPMIDPERLDGQVLSVCDFLVIGSPVYLGEMLIRDWLKENQSRLGATRLFLFVVGTDLTDSGKRLAVIRGNIPTGMLASCEIYFLPGREVVNGLPVADWVPDGEMPLRMMGDIRSFVKGCKAIR